MRIHALLCRAEACVCCCRYQVEDVLIHGKRCPRVDAGKSMRETMVDVTAVPNAKIGDMVLLHGAEDEGQELRKPWNLAAVSISVPRIPKW